MPNKSNDAYGLTVLCPLKETFEGNKSVTLELRKTLFGFDGSSTQEKNPMVKVPNTYLSRFYILEDVFFEDYPYTLEHLQNKYLVFTSNFHGDLDPYLEGMYEAIKDDIKMIWKGCYGIDTGTMDKNTFVDYIKMCQVETTFYFNGSTGDSLNDQLKSLYLKQEFSQFVFENSHKSPEELQKGFNEFLERTQPTQEFPRWKPAGNNLEKIVDDGQES